MVFETANAGRRGAAAGARRALVLGCGGTLGTAWTLAALHEVSRALEWDPRTAHVIVGTSAGAEVATLLGSGVGIEALLAAAVGAPSADAGLARHFAAPPPAWPPWPRARIGSLALATALLPRSLRREGVAREVGALTAFTGLLPEGRGDAGFVDALVDAHVPPPRWVTHRATWIVAVDLETGARVAFGSKGAPPASMRDAVRASWAIPGWFPPVTIGGRRYMDGGVASPASADLLLPRTGQEDAVDDVIVIAPMSSTQQGTRRGLARVEGAVRSAMRRTLDREIGQLRARGMRVLRLEPGPEDLRVMGPSFMDPERRLRVLEASLRSARGTVRAALATHDWAGAGSRVAGSAGSEGAAAWES
jgi:NTE family protein